MSTTALASTLAGGSMAASAMSAVQQYQQGQFAKQAGVVESEQLEQQARQVQQQAGADVAAQDVAAGRTLGAQLTKTAASGTTEEGTPAFLMATSEEEARLNDMYATYAANLKANSLYYQGTLAKVQGEQEADAGTIGAVTTGVSGAVSSGMMAYGLKTKLGTT